MRLKFITVSTICSIALGAYQANAQVHVQGHYTKNGTYVQPHERSAPNQNYFDNYSSKGNVNPHTGQQGTVTYDQYQQEKLQPSRSGGWR